MKISQRGIDIIKRYEGCKLRAYLCSAGVWTIGFGHTQGVKPGDIITQNQADFFLREDIQSFEKDLNGMLRVPTKQSQFDALLSLGYNIGMDVDVDDIAEGLGDSSLLKLHNNEQSLGAAKHFVDWINVKGKPSLGLLRRRLAEAALYLEDL